MVARSEGLIMRRRGLGPLLAVLLLMTVVMAGPAAWADEEESDEAAVLVLQAIALLANENTAQVLLERIEDAVGASMTEGADLDLVEQAAALVEPLVGQEADSLPPEVEREVRGLLEKSIGITPISEPVKMATGIETGTTVVLDEYRPARGVSDGGDGVLLALAAGGLVSGLLLAHRTRPHHSLRELHAGPARVST